MLKKYFKISILIIFLLQISVTKRSFAVEKDNNKPIQVEFYYPVLEDSPKKNRTKLIISGKTTPGSKVYVGSKVIPIITKKNKVKYLKSKSAVIAEKNPKTKRKRYYTYTNKEGYFKLGLLLPNALVQLPIKIRPKGKKASTFQLNLQVKSQIIEVKNQKDLKESPLLRKKYALWAGLGFNYLRYLQSSADIDANLNYDSFKGPAIYLKYWMWLAGNLDLNLEVKRSPGGVKTGKT